MSHAVYDELDLSEVKFLETLFESEDSKIYKVDVHGHVCVLKVYHGYNYMPDDCQETNIFLCESAAYRRLKEKGLCDRGIVPNFYGAITNIQPRLCPGLHLFHDDQLPADAILIEYIPNMQRIHLGNYSKERMMAFRDMLSEIHAARVLHHDPYPRNMMLVPGNKSGNKSERLLWIDFDRAQTYSFDEPIPKLQARWFKGEMAMMEYWIAGLAEDNEDMSLEYFWKRDMTLPGTTFTLNNVEDSTPL